MQRFDILKYPALDKITEKQLGFFWRPEEVDVSKDKKDFDTLQNMNNISLHLISKDKYYWIVFKVGHLILLSYL